jgi:hypothetical protein
MHVSHSQVEIKKMSSDTWIYLNDLGKEKLGHIFPDDGIPAKWILAETATLEDKNDKRKFFRIDINHLSDKQFEQCVDFIMEKNIERGLYLVKRHIVEDEIRQFGYIPIQSKYISGSGTTCVEMFL